jgi:hypothetical protein
MIMADPILGGQKKMGMAASFTMRHFLCRLFYLAVASNPGSESKNQYAW